MNLRRLLRASAIGMAALMVTAGTATASSADQAVADAIGPTTSVSIPVGDDAPITTTITVTGNQAGTATYKVWRDWTLNADGTFTGSNEATSTAIGPRSGPPFPPADVQAFGGTLDVAPGTPCATYTLAVGVHGIVNSNDTGAKLGVGTSSNYAVTVTDCAAPDTDAPVVTVPSDITEEATSPSGNVVTFTASAVDAVDGVRPVTCVPASGSTFAIGTTAVTCSASDLSGNTGYGYFNVNVVDTTDPTLVATLTPAAPDGQNGWYQTNPTLSWTCSDSGSGATTGGGSQTTSSDGADQNLTASCEDFAGNTSSAGAIVSVDTAKPTITGAAAPPPNGAGWNNTDVTVAYTCADDTSGIASCGPDETLSDDGADQSSTGTAVDIAGWSETTTVSGISIDKTAPVVTVTGVTDGATYTLGSVPVAGCDTTDATSGVATDATLSSSGGPVGSITASCTGALDNAGNLGSASATYSVVYNWAGFFQPVDNLPTCNTVKAGQAIPIKFSLGGNQGLNIFAAGYPKTVNAICGGSTTTDAIETLATANTSGLIYDASANQYVYVWKTDKAWAGKSMKLQVKLNDDTLHEALFYFTR